MSNTGQSRPVPLTPLTGRELDLARARCLIRRDDVRLVTLTRPGGVGKTRHALRIAEELTGDFADEVWFVPRTTIGDPELLLPTIAETLSISLPMVTRHVTGGLSKPGVESRGAAISYAHKQWERNS